MYRNIIFFFRRINNGINNHKFNEIRGSLSREEINRITKELSKKEAVYNFLKEKDDLADRKDCVEEHW